MTDQRFDGSHDDLDPAETHAAASQWAAWALHDVEHFIDPVALVTGLSRQEVLLYVLSERLAQLVEGGLTIKVFAQHDIREHPPEDPPKEEWQR